VFPEKLKAAEIAEWREHTLALQGGRCALCSLTCSLEEAVADHCHTSGAMRAVLHRGCNALLGKVENNYKRYGLKNVAAFLNGAAAYLQLHATNRTGMIHPTYKDAEGKRLLRNKRARLARARKKEPNE
jgi:hypothetical protein